MQMGVVIALGAYSGVLIDEKMELETPWATMSLTLLGVGLALYLVLKQVINMSKEMDRKKQSEEEIVKTKRGELDE